MELFVGIIMGLGFVAVSFMGVMTAYAYGQERKNVRM
jgi:hypothetical protein